MGSFGFLFPGQGSQKPGMGKEFFETSLRAKEIFNRAESVLSDCSIKSLCFEADEEELKRTENTQPALYTVSYAIYAVLEESGYTGEVFAGHSLGEYTAVTAAGYMSFEDGLKVVRRRGLLMRDCDPGRKGGMAAILGLDIDQIEKVCQEVQDVWPANFNSPSQIVISGLKEKVNEAMDKLKSIGAKRVIPLNVGGPFHSPFMKDAAGELERELEAVRWKKGAGKIVSNATAKLTDDASTLKQSLVKQLSHPVLWSSSLSALVELGYTKYIECGPGTVLKGLFRSIAKDVQVYSVEKPGDIEGIGV
jgi:[acyl-carrier-protein] S-malonyltransferase